MLVTGIYDAKFRSYIYICGSVSLQKTFGFCVAEPEFSCKTNKFCLSLDDNSPLTFLLSLMRDNKICLSLDDNSPLTSDRYRPNTN